MNVGYYVTRAARFFGDRIAVYDGERAYTFSQVDERSNRLAHALQALGVARRDRVALVLPNSIEWIEAEFAIAKAGAMTVPLGARLHEQELARDVNICDPGAVVTDADTAPRLRPLLDPDLPMIVLGGAGGDPAATDYEAAMAKASPDAICVEVDEAVDGRVMRFTSGTTGTPKGVYLTHRNWHATAHGHLLDRWSIQPDDVFMAMSPYPHAGGLWIVPAFIRGAAMRVLDKFDPEMVLDLVEARKATVLQLVPTALRRLLDVPGMRDRELGALRSIHYGGSPIDPETLREALDVFGPKMVQGYGLNEAPTVCVLSGPDHEKVVDYRDWHQPLGREFTMAEIALLDADGAPVEDGGIGEVAIRGPMVFLEYWRNPEATAAARDERGYFRTGDLALRGDHGFLFMAGRSKEIIITGGYNVSPVEVESALYKHAAVHQCAVVGLPDREWGEKVTAFVIPAAGSTVSAQELIGFCGQHLTGYKKPKEVRFVDSLPLNSNGKILRRALREQMEVGELNRTA